MPLISEKKSLKLSDYVELNHFTTHRLTESKQDSDYNLSLKAGTQIEKVLNNRKALASELKIPELNLIFPDQCHTGNIRIVINNTLSHEFSETDALISNEKNICLCVLAADCVPILLYDPVKKVIAAVHAGWRGSEKKIAASCVQKMVNEFQCNSSHIVAFIGPSICKDCYQVGKEVVSIFKQQGYPENTFSSYTSDGKANIDLWKINQLQLISAGLKTENIEISGTCTYENQKFFSARRDGFHTGRFGVGIMMV